MNHFAGVCETHSVGATIRHNDGARQGSRLVEDYLRDVDSTANPSPA